MVLCDVFHAVGCVMVLFDVCRFVRYVMFLCVIFTCACACAYEIAPHDHPSHVICVVIGIQRTKTV